MKKKFVIMMCACITISMLSFADTATNYNAKSEQTLQQILPSAPLSAPISPIESKPVLSGTCKGSNPNISPTPSMPIKGAKQSFAQLSTQVPTLVNGSGTSANCIQRTFNYEKNSQYPLYCRVGYITTIYLESGENVEYIAGGDVQRWTIDIGQAGTNDGSVEVVVIKPFDIGIKTNLMVNTNLRSYQFLLNSTTSQYNAVVRFNYPKGLAPANAAIAVNKYSNPSSNNLANMNYGYYWNSKNLYWAPSEVYDNGHQTFIHMKDGLRHQDAPVLMGEDSSTGELQVINYRVDGNYYIVDRLITSVVLRLEDQNIVIKKEGYFHRNKYDNYIYVR